MDMMVKTEIFVRPGGRLAGPNRELLGVQREGKTVPATIDDLAREEFYRRMRDATAGDRGKIWLPLPKPQVETGFVKLQPLDEKNQTGDGRKPDKTKGWKEPEENEAKEWDSVMPEPVKRRMMSPVGIDGVLASRTSGDRFDFSVFKTGFDWPTDGVGGGVNDTGGRQKKP